MSSTTAEIPASTKAPSKALRYWAWGLTAYAVLAMVFMVSGFRPEGWLLDVSEATSTLSAPIALIVNAISVARQHRTALDIASLVVAALVVAVLAADAIIYTLAA